MATGRPASKVIGDVFGLDLDRLVPVAHAHDRLNRFQGGAQQLEGLGLVGCTPDVGVGGVGLFGRVAVREVALDEPFAHFLAAAEFRDECRVQPRLVDAQLRVGEQAVAVEALDVVALVGGAVAPDVNTVFAHGADQQGAGDGAAQRGGVEVGLSAGADVEGATGQGNKALFNQCRLAVDKACGFCAVLQGAARDCINIRFIVLTKVAGVRVRDRHPFHASRQRQRTYRGHRRTRYLRVRQRAGR